MTGADGHWRNALYIRPVWKTKGTRRSSSFQQTAVLSALPRSKSKTPADKCGWSASLSALSKCDAANTLAPAHCRRRVRSRQTSGSSSKTRIDRPAKSKLPTTPSAKGLSPMAPIPDQSCVKSRLNEGRLKWRGPRTAFGHLAMLHENSPITNRRNHAACQAHHQRNR